ncbi:MAG: hypothetical protein U0521_16280 [Anaerolineae bacterium]
MLLGMVVVALTYAAGRALFPPRPAIALTAAALLAFEGNTLLLSSEISSIPLLRSPDAANVLICAHLARRMTPRLILLLLVTVGLALLTRLPGWALLAFDIPFVLLVSLIQPRAAVDAHPARADPGRRTGAGRRSRDRVQPDYLRQRPRSLQQPCRRDFTHASEFPPALGDHRGRRQPDLHVAYLEPLALLTPRAIIATAYGAVAVVGVLARRAL